MRRYFRLFLFHDEQPKCNPVLCKGLKKTKSEFCFERLEAETESASDRMRITVWLRSQSGVRILIRPNTMWRAFFCAIGIVLIIMGIECLLIDSAVLVAGVLDDPTIQIQQQSGGLFAPPVQKPVDRVFRPSEWFPWSLLATGAITLLYSISLRRNGTS